MTEAAVVTADRLARRRARMLIVLAIVFITNQGAVIGKAAKFDSWGTIRTVDAMHVSAWFVMALALLVLLFTGGGLFRSAEVRQLMDDEGTRENRRRALAIGFGNAMATCILIYALAMFKPVSGPEAIHIVMTVGIASALIAFGVAERLALADG